MINIHIWFSCHNTLWEKHFNFFHFKEDPLSMTVHSRTPTIAYISWLKLTLDLFIVIYLKIFNFLSSLLQYISKSPGAWKETLENAGKSGVEIWNNLSFYFVFQILWNIFCYSIVISFSMYLCLCLKNWCLCSSQFPQNILFQSAMNSSDFRKKLVLNINN